ncbi:MAG: hypothetical protein WCE80_03850 [Acidimicrobiia bacterium]
MQPVIELLGEIGDRYWKSPGQVALRWLIENPLVLPIPGAKNGIEVSTNAGPSIPRSRLTRSKNWAG